MVYLLILLLFDPLEISGRTRIRPYIFKHSHFDGTLKLYENRLIWALFNVMISSPLFFHMPLGKNWQRMALEENLYAFSKVETMPFFFFFNYYCYKVNFLRLWSSQRRWGGNARYQISITTLLCYYEWWSKFWSYENPEKYQGPGEVIGNSCIGKTVKGF